ncbi:MAG: hypothetical protein HYV52_01840 [Parcubacteria group bacterium]|nr:hypothetical protein [Parcubacteria group bacterium]
MPSNILEQLFSSVTRPRLLKLFLRHKNDYFTSKEIIRKIKASKESVKKEINFFIKIGLIQSRMIKHPLSKKKERMMFLRPDFYFLKELGDLILKPSIISRKNLIKKIISLGNIKLAVLSGIFINEENTRADLLLVGSRIKQRNLSNFLAGLEAELGKEINYVLLSEEEFRYRMNMFDRFLRDLLEGPHEILIEKIKIE